MAFGALRDRSFGSRDVPELLKGEVNPGGLLAVLLYGCESWCPTVSSIRRLRSWHSKRVREMCRVTMFKNYVNRITSNGVVQNWDLSFFGAKRRQMWPLVLRNKMTYFRTGTILQQIQFAFSSYFISVRIGLRTPRQPLEGRGDPKSFFIAPPSDRGVCYFKGCCKVMVKSPAQRTPYQYKNTG